MRKSVRRRHNKDGSVTTTTTYSRKGLFGTRHVDTYVSKSAPSQKQPTRLKPSNAVAVIVAVASFLLLWVLGIELELNAVLLKAVSIIIIVLFVAFMFINNIPPLKNKALRLLLKDKKSPDELENNKNYEKE